MKAFPCVSNFRVLGPRVDAQGYYFRELCAPCCEEHGGEGTLTTGLPVVKCGLGGSWEAQAAAASWARVMSPWRALGTPSLLDRGDRGKGGLGAYSTSLRPGDEGRY